MARMPFRPRVFRTLVRTPITPAASLGASTFDLGFTRAAAIETPEAMASSIAPVYSAIYLNDFTENLS